MKEYNSILLEDKEVQFLEDITNLSNKIVQSNPFSGDIETAIKNFEAISEVSFLYENHHIIGLIFYNSDLESLPKSIGNLLFLKFIIMYGCSITRSLPSTFKNLKDLEIFQISNTSGYEPIAYIDLPDIFRDLKNLKVIKIIGPVIVFIPPSFVKMEKLEELHLERCLFTTNRENFLLNYNRQDPERIEYFYDLPEDIGNIKSLKSLILRSLKIKELPPSIINLLNLREVDLSLSDKINNIDIIFDIKSLRKINLNRCGIINLPKRIGNLKHLESLNLSDNNIKEVPFEITYCKNLKDLFLKLTTRKDTIQNWINYLNYLPKLKYLEINKSYLEFLPKEIVKRKNLVILTDF